MREVDAILRTLRRLPYVEIQDGAKHLKVRVNGRYVVSLSRSPAKQDQHAIRKLRRTLERAGCPLSSYPGRG